MAKNIRKIAETPQMSIHDGKRPHVDGSPFHGDTHLVSPVLAELSRTASERTFASEEEGIACLIESVVAKLGSDNDAQVEMREFLYLLLETDPILRDEILANLNIED